MTDVEDVLMGVDALDEDPLEPMGKIMRMISAEVVRATSVGYWTPKPIAEAILALSRERDLAVAHDRQPYPTAWAYEQACRVRDEWQQRAQDLANAILDRPWADPDDDLAKMARAIFRRHAAASAADQTDTSSEE